MKTRITLFILLFTTITFAQSDNFPGSVKMTESLKSGSLTGYSAIIGSDDEFVYITRIIGAKFHFEKYKLSDLTLATAVFNNLKVEKARPTYEKGFMLGESICAISILYDYKSESYKFYYYLLDKSSLNGLGPLLLDERIITEGTKSEGSFFGTVNIQSTKNNSSFLFSYNDIKSKVTSNDVSKTKYNQKLILFDDECQRKKEALFELPVSGFTITHRNIIDDSTVYFFGYSMIPDPNAAVEEKKFLRVYRMCTLNLITSKVNSLEINTENYILPTLSFYLSESKEIILAGLTRTGPEGNNGANGCVQIKMDNSLKQTDLIFTPFEDKFILDNSDVTEFEKQKEKNPNAVPAFQSFGGCKIVQANDGHVLIIAEQYFFKTSTVTSNGVQSLRYNHHYDDLIVMYYASNGELEWKNYVPKTQLSIDDNGAYSSVYPLIKEDKVLLIYNEAIDYFDDPKGKEIVSLKTMDKDFQMVMVTIDEEGNSTKLKIPNMTNLKATRAEIRKCDEGLVMIVSNNYDEHIAIISLE